MLHGNESFQQAFDAMYKNITCTQEDLDGMCHKSHTADNKAAQFHRANCNIEHDVDAITDSLQEKVDNLISLCSDCKHSQGSYHQKVLHHEPYMPSSSCSCPSSSYPPSPNLDSPMLEDWDMSPTFFCDKSLCHTEDQQADVIHGPLAMGNAMLQENNKLLYHELDAVHDDFMHMHEEPYHAITVVSFTTMP